MIIYGSCCLDYNHSAPTVPTLVVRPSQEDQGGYSIVSLDQVQLRVSERVLDG